jgi:hypothetical protein
MTEIVDKGGHLQTVIHYKNTTIKLDDASLLFQKLGSRI